MQIESSNRIRASMLGWIGIIPDEHEIYVHYLLCTEKVSPDVSLRATESWARRLLQGNNEHCVFQRRFFNHEVIQHFFVISVNRNCKARDAQAGFKPALMRQALSPAIFTVILNESCFQRAEPGI
jgi:hypothetical protein